MNKTIDIDAPLTVHSWINSALICHNYDTRKRLLAGSVDSKKAQ